MILRIDFEQYIFHLSRQKNSKLFKVYEHPHLITSWVLMKRYKSLQLPAAPAAYMRLIVSACTANTERISGKLRLLFIMTYEVMPQPSQQLTMNVC